MFYGTGRLSVGEKQLKEADGMDGKEVIKGKIEGINSIGREDRKRDEKRERKREDRQQGR